MQGTENVDAFLRRMSLWLFAIASHGCDGILPALDHRRLPSSPPYRLHGPSKRSFPCHESAFVIRLSSIIYCIATWTFHQAPFHSPMALTCEIGHRSSHFPYSDSRNRIGVYIGMDGSFVVLYFPQENSVVCGYSRVLDLIACFR